MLNTHKLLRIAITTSALVALCATQQIAHAETVSITGNIQGETCVLKSFGDLGEIRSKNLPLPLGDFSLTTLSDTAAAGSVFGVRRHLNFFLANQDGSFCTFRNGASGWDISIAPAKSGYITTINGATFLSNMVSLADGGTNAVVKLSGNDGSTFNQIMVQTEPNGCEFSIRQAWKCTVSKWILRKHPLKSSGYRRSKPDFILFRSSIPKANKSFILQKSFSSNYLTYRF
jgi:hypothetical protein